MSSKLFGVDVKAAVLGALAGNLMPATLYKLSSATGDMGEPIETAVPYDAEGVRTSWDSKTAVARGYPVEAVKLILLANGIPDPVKGDQVLILGDRWRVLDVGRDPVNATFTLAGVLETGAPPSAGTSSPAQTELVITWGD